MTHQALISEYISAPQGSRNAVDLTREGAGKSGAVWPIQIVDFITLKRYDFERIAALVNLWIHLSHTAGNTHGGDTIEQSHLNEFHERLERTRDNLNYVGLVQSAKYISNIRTRLHEGECKTYSEYHDQVEVLDDLVSNEIEGMVFGFLPRDHGKYFNQTVLFGEAVNDEFKGAQYDIREAGNCYAHGTYTACVFHLMRVLEIALHSMANDLGVTFKATIELENWNTIIEKIESAIRDREKQLPKGAQKSEEMQYYSEAAKEFRYFKDAWRNHVSHSRVDYEVHDASKIMEHVRDFMRQLASKT